MTSQELAARQIEEDEGRRSQVYLDTLNNQTIGVGHLMLAGEPDSPWDEGLIDRVFSHDLFTAHTLATLWISGFHFLAVPRQATLINLSFTLSTKVFKFSRLKASINTKDWEASAIEILNSTYATQVGKAPGQRAWRLAEQMRTGHITGRFV